MNTAKNVLGEVLEVCGQDPVTGFYRDGCCSTGRNDEGLHLVCAEVTAEFLMFSRERGNDLTTPMPEFGFAGLQPGDRGFGCSGGYGGIPGSVADFALYIAVPLGGWSSSTSDPTRNRHRLPIRSPCDRRTRNRRPGNWHEPAR